MPAGSQQLLGFLGRCGIPNTARAVAANVTAVTPTATGFLSIYPGDEPPNDTSTVAFRPGTTRATSAILYPSKDEWGFMRIFNQSPGTVHYIVDVSGYFE